MSQNLSLKWYKIKNHDSLTIVTMEGRSSESMLDPTYVRSYAWNQFFLKFVHYWNPSTRGPIYQFISFGKILHRDSNLETEKSGEVDFPVKFMFVLEWGKWAQNGVFLSFRKVLSLFFAVK